MTTQDIPAPSAGQCNTEHPTPATIKVALSLTTQLLRQQRDPYVLSYLDDHHGRVPDEMYDDGMNGRHRADRALKVWGQLAHLEDDHHLLVMVTINGGGHDPAALYNGKARQWAKRRVRALFGRAPFFARVEYGADTGIHVHVVLPLLTYAQAHRAGAQVDNVELVWNTWGLARYLSKPADSRAALSGHRRQADPVELAHAVTLYLRERARDFRAKHRAAQRKGQAPPTSTRLPSTRFSSPGLPTAGNEFSEVQCVMGIHPFQWHLKPVPHGEDITDEPARRIPVWIKVMSQRLQPRPVRRVHFQVVRFSRELLDGAKTPTEDGAVTPEGRTIPPVSLKAQECGPERLQLPRATFHVSIPGPPDHAAPPPPPGRAAVHGVRQRRGQFTDQRGPLPDVDVGQLP